MKLKTGSQQRKINKTKSCFLKKIKKIDKPLDMLIRKKRDDTNY